MVAPTLMAIGLTWLLGLVSTKLLPTSWFALLLTGMLGLITLTLDATRRARA